MMLFATPEQQRLGAALRRGGRMARGRFSAGRFANGEMFVRIVSRCRGRSCVALGAIEPPPERLMSFLLLCHTLRKDGAARVTAVLPYLAYSRQDRIAPGESLATAWLGGLLRASGIDRLVTVDLHNPNARGLLRVPVRSLSPAPRFAGLIRDPASATFVAPDRGAVERCRALARAAGGRTPIVTFEKERTRRGATSVMRGTPGPRAVIVDDILDTGATLAACARTLRDAGCRDVTVVVTHALFTGDAAERLRAAGVRRILCTDAVPLRAPRPGVRVVSVAPLLLEELSHGLRGSS